MPASVSKPVRSPLSAVPRDRLPGWNWRFSKHFVEISGTNGAFVGNLQILPKTVPYAEQHR